jgi:hypothetical protein
MTAALETPIQAIAQLAPRMKPYIAWASQYRTKNSVDEGRESWKAGWYLRLYQGAADKLTTAFEKQQIRFTDAEKAQLFIGYLASFPKKDADEESQIKQSQGEVL